MKIINRYHSSTLLIKTHKSIYITCRAILIVAVYAILNFIFSTNTLAWYTNPYPYPGGSIDCQYNYIQLPNEIDISITPSSSQQIIWLSIENSSGSSASWQFLDPNQSWPSTYPWQPNRDAESYTAYSLNDSVGFQNGGTGAWIRQIIPNGIYKLYYTGSLDISKVNIVFQNLDLSWSKICTTLPATTPSPPPPQTPSPNPDPTPIANKVLLIPGFGASWNTNSFANCTFDPNEKNWILAPYAETIYQPIITALASTGSILKNFNYDWRQKISVNSDALVEYINNFAPENEKIKIIGHSLGGLIAVDYSINHVDDNKISELITVGSPFKGVVRAYPAWAGGDIWEDSFIAKVAMTLYLKHCGGIVSNNRENIQNQIPSINNLLPTFNYLVELKTGSEIPFQTMVNKNDWSIDLNKLFKTKFKTLTGAGFDTLTNIPIKPPNKKDVQQYDWVDGKPAGKVYSSQGDGTVLLSSGKLDETHNTTIQQSHSGLISSEQGITEILKSINIMPTITINPEIATENYLIVISHPANFWVTDKKGYTKTDNQGIVALKNPKPEKYHITIFPKSTNTLFVVAQFLPTGQVKYLERHFEGLGPKIKTIDLNSETFKTGF